MVKQRGLPPGRVVAFHTWSGLAACELRAVNVLVAFLALARRGLEVHIDQLRFHVGRLVTVTASRSSVGPGQGKRGFRVVKT